MVHEGGVNHNNRSMLSQRGVHKLKKAFTSKKKPVVDVAPECPKHHCDITDFQCGSWNVVACRGCLNLESVAPTKRRNLARSEAVSRSSDLIFKILAEGQDEVSLKELNGRGKEGSQGHPDSFHRMSNRTPTWFKDAKASEKKTRELLEEFNHLVRAKETDESESATFMYCKDSDDDEEEEIAVNGLLGHILQDLCELKSSGADDRDSRPISVSEYLDFVKKACKEDHSVGNISGKNATPGVKSETTKEESLSRTGVVARKIASKALNAERSRQSFTALVHLNDSAEEEQLLSVHGLLGRVLHDLCEKKTDTTSTTSRDSRPVPVAEYIALVKKACEADSSLGGIESNVKEHWNLRQTFDFELPQRLENVTAIAANPNGDFAIADRVSKQAVIFDAFGHFKFTLDNLDSSDILCAPRGIATNSRGEYFIVDGTKTVKIYSSNGSLKGVFHTTTENGHPTCITVGSNDRVLVGDKRSTVLTLHTAEGKLLHRINTAAKPNFLAMNSDNDIFISDIARGKVHAIDCKGNPIFTMDTVIEGTRYKAFGLCCDLADDIYVTLQSDNSLSNPVCRFSPRGKLLGCVAKDLRNPQALCFTATEKLLVADGECVKQFIMQ